MEGLDSEFLVIAESEAHAKQVCLQMLAEDQDMHLKALKEQIEGLEKRLEKQFQNIDTTDPSQAFLVKVYDRNKENVVKFKALYDSFNGYKEECLSVKKINSRLKNGYIQFDDEVGSTKKW